MTGLILAGGRGSRMGGIDKGLEKFQGMPLALHTLSRLRKQQGGTLAAVAISANRNLASYEAFGVAVWTDTLADYAGPLAGFLSGLENCQTPYLLTVPCDTPRFPLDLASRLLQALVSGRAEIAMVCAREADAEGKIALRPQPVFSLLKADLLASLRRFTENGGRRVGEWAARHETVRVNFDSPGDDPNAFCNANTLDELHRLEAAAQ